VDVASAPQLLARGPWDPSDLEVAWRSDPFRPDANATAEADRILERLRSRGSPSYDGLAAGLVSFEQANGRLKLELQPIRWALRLLSNDSGSSVSALCVVRDASGRWLAGRRADWVASWAGRWALGAGGSVELDENPADTLGRELQEEWSVVPDQIAVEALVRLPSGMVMVVGQAWLPDGTRVTPDHEHDEYAWWPAEIDDWPDDADPALRLIGSMLAGG
jgi:8-oxo-dGTP diphosphatase